MYTRLSRLRPFICLYSSLVFCYRLDNIREVRHQYHLVCCPTLLTTVKLLSFTIFSFSRKGNVHVRDLFTYQFAYIKKNQELYITEAVLCRKKI